MIVSAGFFLYIYIKINIIIRLNIPNLTCLRETPPLPARDAYVSTSFSRLQIRCNLADAYSPIAVPTDIEGIIDLLRRLEGYPKSTQKLDSLNHSVCNVWRFLG